MLAYCGLDCAKCVGFIATRSGDPRELAKVAGIWSKKFNAEVKPGYVVCDGCKGTGRKSFYCANMCKIAGCCAGREFATCAECPDYACLKLREVLDNSPEAKANLERLRGK